MKILLLNQAFYPDVVATAQYSAELALELRSRGHEVTVVCSDRGYDDPSRRFASSEDYRGVRVLRVGHGAFGKKTKLARAFGFASLMAGMAFRMLSIPRQDAVVALTSPPLVAWLGALFCRLKGGRLVYWVMDLNPDEAIAAGWLKERSFAAKILTALNRDALRFSARVVVLDGYMKRLIVGRYGVDPARVDVLPPWSHDEGLRPVPHAENAFRREHGLEDKFVVMYAGNHSPCHPLDTLLEAAVRLRNDPSVVFCFVGGGSEFPKVAEFARARGLSSVRTLPYQRMDRLAEALSAADLHAAVMGAPFVGIVHPSKIYGILAVGRPFVFVGPDECPMGDLCRESGLGRRVDPGDAEGFAAAVNAARSASGPECADVLRRSLEFKERFSLRTLGPVMANWVEKTAEF